MLPGSQPEDKAFSELLAPNILGVTACMLIFNVFCVYAWSISFRTQIFRVDSVVRSMTEASFLTSLVSGGLVSCWCSLTLSNNSNEKESECGIINCHMLFSWQSCSMCHACELNSEQWRTFKCNHNQAGTSLSMLRDSIFWSGRHSCGCLPLPAGHNQNQAAVPSGDFRMRMDLQSLIGCLIKPSIWFYMSHC